MLQSKKRSMMASLHVYAASEKLQQVPAKHERVAHRVLHVRDALLAPVIAHEARASLASHAPAHSSALQAQALDGGMRLEVAGNLDHALDRILFDPHVQRAGGKNELVPYEQVLLHKYCYTG
jgi:hypothetical protein